MYTHKRSCSVSSNRNMAALFASTEHTDQCMAREGTVRGDRPSMRAGKQQQLLQISTLWGNSQNSYRRLFVALSACKTASRKDLVY
jgi:hypothetical protein